MLRSWDDQDSVQEQAAGTKTLVTTGAMGSAKQQRDDKYAPFYVATSNPTSPIIMSGVTSKMLDVTRVAIGYSISCNERCSVGVMVGVRMV